MVGGSAVEDSEEEEEEDEERERDGQRGEETEMETRREEGRESEPREREGDLVQKGDVLGTFSVDICGICVGKDVAGERGRQGERDSIGLASLMFSLRASARSADAWEDN